ncbi:MAG: hypothetical protein J0I98_06460 [Mesorhizobium sp.]|nr:hypothetical protein [Mesorhizobium sp.]MBN9242418.1 hypothetical protein [Mesorhizobium sp.]
MPYQSREERQSSPHPGLLAKPPVAPAPPSRTAYANRPRLLAGPYVAPTVQCGDVLADEIDGDVEVGSYSAGRIAWPCRRKPGRRSLILTGDLVLAVRTESSEAIQYWFGVGAVTAWKWRSALGVDRQNNAGTQKLYRDLKPAKLTPDRAAKGRIAAASPAAIERMAAAKRGVPAHPRTRAALIEAAKAPKPDGWGERANRWMLAGKAATPETQKARPGEPERAGKCRWCAAVREAAGLSSMCRRRPAIRRRRPHRSRS